MKARLGTWPSSDHASNLYKNFKIFMFLEEASAGKHSEQLGHSNTFCQQHSVIFFIMTHLAMLRKGSRKHENDKVP